MTAGDITQTRDVEIINPELVLQRSPRTEQRSRWSSPSDVDADIADK